MDASSVIRMKITNVGWSLLLAVLLCRGTNRALNATEVCRTKACIEKAKFIMDNMDEKADPCDDFYTYACGSHQKGGGADALDPVDQVRAKVASDLSEIFQNLPNITEADSASDKVALAYHVCMNSELSEDQEMAVITINLSKKGLGQWPLFPSGPDKKREPQSVEDILEKTGLSSVFEIDVVKDKAGHSAILLGPLPPKMYFTWHMIDVLQNSSDPDDLKPLQIRALKTAVKMLTPYVVDDQVEQYANSVVEFAEKWVKLQEAVMSMKRTTKNSTAMTINEIESEIPSVPWLKLFNNEFKKVGTTLTDAEIIEVFALDNLKGLVEFYSENVVSAYNSLGAYEAHNLLWYSSKAYRDAIAEIFGKKAGELEDMAESCEMLLTEMMPEVVSKLYVENNFNDDTKWQARYVLNAIGKRYYEEVMRVPWADQESKKPAMEKIWNIVPYVGYAPWLMNASFVDGLYENVGRLRRNDAMSTITQRLEENALIRRLSRLCDVDREPTIGVAFETVGMIYIPPSVLVVPAGILQTPFFEPGLPSSVNFGTIGTAMAHEMTVDLIQKGLHYDSRGMIRRWWTDYTQASFYDRADCLLKQYGSIVDTPANMTPYKMNRLIEAVADNAALRIAFQLINSSLDEVGKMKCTMWCSLVACCRESADRHQCKLALQIICEEVADKALQASAEEKPMMSLPGLEKFSPEQLYFLSYASLLCAYESAEGNEETGVTIEQFRNRYRVNVPMMNMEEFSSTFQCPSGSRMRLEDGNRCALI